MQAEQQAKVKLQGQKASFCWRGFEGLVIAPFWIGASLAQFFSIAYGVAVVIDALTAKGTECAFRFVAGKFIFVERYLHPLLAEKNVRWQFAIGQHLLLILVVDFRVQLTRSFPGGFASRDAHGAAAFDIDKRRRHLAPVAKLQRAFAETAAGDDGDGIRGAAVNLHEYDQALAIFSARIGQAESSASQHRHTHAEHLAGAEMAVGNFRFLQQLVHILHVSRVRIAG